MTSPWRADSPVAAEVLPSPNHGERREDRRPDMLLLHYTGMPRTDEALAWLCDPASSVSCHYFVFEDGRVVQIVPEARRAWHAGAASWGADRDINSCSIGVEIANPGHDGGLPPFPAPQIAAVTALGRDIVGRWSIPPERVLAHSDVAPGRKQDPGERFPWAELNGAGLGHWVQPAPVRRRPRSPSRRAGRRRSRPCRPCWHVTATGSPRAASSTRAPPPSWPPSSAISGRRASTASPMSRRSPRCRR